jgi:nucleotidyltransferase AbiEii toxin of type IV toxin-antitoxin system
MAEDTLDKTVWHPETITAGTQRTLRALRDRSLIGDAYLAGGTGLALHFGHRLSVDLDFFIANLFDEDIFLARVQAMPDFSLVAKAPHTIHAVTEGTKVSFLGYPYPALFPLLRFLDVQVADARDIACMKMGAIASRGTKRDFIDLYVASERFGLRRIVEWFDRKYAQTRYNRLHILKSLTFFQDALKDPMPHMLTPVDWDDVVGFFRREAAGLLKSAAE